MLNQLIRIQIRHILLAADGCLMDGLLGVPTPFHGYSSGSKSFFGRFFVGPQWLTDIGSFTAWVTCLYGQRPTQLLSARLRLHQQ